MRSAFFLAVAVAGVLAGCGGGTPVKLYKSENFQSDAAFSKTIPLPSDIVCRSLKRALLSQGYIIDKTPGSKDSPWLAGTKSWQPEEDVAVTLHLQVTCTHENENSTTVFATAIEEAFKLQTVTGSVSAGVSIATVTMPTSSGRALMPVRRETIQDPKFYARFYDLVQKYAEADMKSGPQPMAVDKIGGPPPMAEDKTRGSR
jgi:hypothetical protein